MDYELPQHPRIRKIIHIAGAYKQRHSLYQKRGKRGWFIWHFTVFCAKFNPEMTSQLNRSVEYESAKKAYLLRFIMEVEGTTAI